VHARARADTNGLRASGRAGAGAVWTIEQARWLRPEGMTDEAAVSAWEEDSSFSRTLGRERTTIHRIL
jgi:hypothetical protein